MKTNDALLSILSKSHAQAMAGQAIPMQNVEHFIEYVKNNRMDDATVLGRINRYY